MNEELSGRCLCGCVSYALRPGERSAIYACHCTDCQTRTGSAFSEHMLVRLAELKVEGATDSYDRQLADGSCASLVGCPVCKVRIYAANSKRPGLATLRCGTLDQSAKVAPAAHFWIRGKQSWVKIPSGSPQHMTQPKHPFEWLATPGTGPKRHI